MERMELVQLCHKAMHMLHIRNINGINVYILKNVAIPNVLTFSDEDKVISFCNSLIKSWDRPVKVQK